MAVAAALAIGAGAAIYSAKKQGDAAKKGSEAQQRAAFTAGQQADRLYNQQTQLMSPWVNEGAAAQMTLGRLMGAPAGSLFASPGAGPAPGLQMGGGSGFAMPRNGSAPGGANGPRRAPTLADMAAMQMPQPQPMAPAVMSTRPVPRPAMPQADPRYAGNRYLNLYDFAGAA